MKLTIERFEQDASHVIEGGVVQVSEVTVSDGEFFRTVSAGEFAEIDPNIGHWWAEVLKAERLNAGESE